MPKDKKARATNPFKVGDVVIVSYDREATSTKYPEKVTSGKYVFNVYSGRVLKITGSVVRIELQYVKGRLKGTTEAIDFDVVKNEDLKYGLCIFPVAKADQKAEKPAPKKPKKRASALPEGEKTPFDVSETVIYR